MTVYPDDVQPVEPSSAGKQERERATSKELKELPTDQLPAITGHVSRDISGLAQIYPELLAGRGAIYIAASYMAEQRETREELSTRLDRAQARNEELSAKVATLEASNARLDQALRDERKATTPRAGITSFAGVFVGVAAERAAANDWGLAILLAVAGIVIGGVAMLWRTSEKNP